MYRGFKIVEVDGKDESFGETVVLGEGLVASNDGNGKITVSKTFLALGPDDVEVRLSIVDLSYTGSSLPPSPDYLRKIESVAKQVVRHRAKKYRKLLPDELVFNFYLTHNATPMIALDPNLLHFQLTFDNLGQHQITAGAIDIMEMDIHMQVGEGAGMILQWELDQNNPTDAVFTDILPKDYGWPESGLFGKLRVHFIGHFVDRVVIHLVDAASMQPISVDDFLCYMSKPFLRNPELRR